MVPTDILHIVVISVRSGLDSHRQLLSETRKQLLLEGVGRHNIDERIIPSDLDIPLACSIALDYVDLDGIVVVGTEYIPAVAEALIRLQVECNAPIEYRYTGMKECTSSGVIEMIQFEDDMYLESAKGQQMDETEYIQPTQGTKKKSRVN